MTVYENCLTNSAWEFIHLTKEDLILVNVNNIILKRKENSSRWLLLAFGGKKGFMGDVAFDQGLEVWLRKDIS